MKGASVGAIVLLAMLAGCGGGTTRPSGLSNRAFVSNSFSGTGSSGVVQIVNASNDTVSGTTVSAGTSPGIMVVSPGHEVTMVFDSGSNGAGVNEISVIDNETEVTTGTIQLPGATESIIAQNATTGFATVRNANTGASDSGALIVLDLGVFPPSTTSTTPPAISATIPVPRAHRIVMNPAATKLLVFSDSYSPAACSGSSALTVFDIASSTATPVCGFNQAVWGVFSSDGNTAYIMNCGPECVVGTASASVQPLTMSAVSVTTTANTTAVVAGTSVPVPAATVGLLSGNTLYVAGSPAQGPLQGVLSVINVSSGTPVLSTTVSIGDGYHTQMVLGSNNKLFIGVRGGTTPSCTNDPTSTTPTGCLTIFDTSAMTAVVDTANGNVTGMAPIANRNVVYVVEGQQLQVHDTTSTSAKPTTIAITGQMVDVKTVDQ